MFVRPWPQGLMWRGTGSSHWALSDSGILIFLASVATISEPGSPRCQRFKYVSHSVTVTLVMWVKILADIINTSMHVTQSNWEALHSLFGYRNKRKKWVSVYVWTRKCHSVLTPASLQVCILPELQLKRTNYFHHMKTSLTPVKFLSLPPLKVSVALGGIQMFLISTWVDEKKKENKSYLFNDKIASILQKPHVYVRFYYCFITPTPQFQLKSPENTFSRLLSWN